MNNQTHSTPWGAAEKSAWLTQQDIKRSYHDIVVEPIMSLKYGFQVSQYGALAHDIERYPLLMIKSNNWNDNNKTILITGGVHGYETSGILGVIRFMQDKAKHYSATFNFIALPCISPWGFETINRWNPLTLDPNRSFTKDSPCDEARLAMDAISAQNTDIIAHIDCHETTDTDNTEFRPALSARDGVLQDEWDIPDGFYLVGDTENPQHDFQKAIIQSVEKVTHIAPDDGNGFLLGEPLTQHGVINYAVKSLGLCTSATAATYVTTTEVYPDSPRVDDENCIIAQVAAISGALDYLSS